MRKLSTIERILEVKELPNSDFLEIVKVRGWTLVVKKGEFKEGDKCVYFEIDSLLPVRPEFEFLRKFSYKKLANGAEGFQIKTVKLRGQVSQGLALPLNIFSDLPSEEIGYCLDSYLDITKYEPSIPAQLIGDVVGVFPSFIPKTNQERIQNLWLDIDNYRDYSFEETLKLDGMSMTVFYKDGKFGVCSRNYQLKEDINNTLWKVFYQTGLQDAVLKKNIAFQGELIGENIQNNPEKIVGHKWFIFDIWDIDNQEYLYPRKRKYLCDSLGLDHVPIYNENIKILKNISLENLLKRAEGDSLYSPNREGLVYKSKKLSFKVISNNFLVKFD